MNAHTTSRPAACSSRHLTTGDPATAGGTMNTHDPSPHRVRTRTAVIGTTLAAATALLAQPAPAAHATPPASATSCSLTAAAYSLPVSIVSVVTTVRIEGGETQVLHLVECDGHTIGVRWLGPSDILTDDVIG